MDLKIRLWKTLSSSSTLEQFLFNALTELRDNLKISGLNLVSHDSNSGKSRVIAYAGTSCDLPSDQPHRRAGDRDEHVIIGAQSGLEPVMEKVRLVAPTDLPVMLFGETGSGKEVVARAIHENSSRKAEPFLRVNCGAIAPQLMDSALFGHERGSFTGADQLHKGWFERANGGTLFLDEIAELPEAAQVRLLRILQDGTFERVGGEKSIKVDVRIVGATHRELSALVNGGTFRRDLWYRLASFPIDIPSLRDRKEDIPALARHFIQVAATKFGIPTPPLTHLDIDLLAAYDWPGNIRELISVVDRAVLLSKGDHLETALALGNGSLAPVSKNSDSYVGKDEAAPLNLAIKEHIEDALTQARGRVEGPFGAAKILGINPNTLRSKIKKLGVDPSRFKKAA